MNKPKRPDVVTLIIPQELQAEVKAKIEKMDTNFSQYVRGLIRKDLEQGARKDGGQ